MVELELLAPARNADIGIAAIDCGADAVYMAGPAFGARKDAGNPIEEVGRLCSYAHKFGVRIFLTVNILLRDEELEEVHKLMLRAQEAGVDAFIIRDTRICGWKDITIPLHASTQCAIRTAERAVEFEKAGCSRIVLERELSLEKIREIRAAVNCEIEFFVHGALCVCYSGECRLSEEISGRSADRGECIQACRSLYDLADNSGHILVKDKALLSLKDYNLSERISDLAESGVCSFKIEGRLKNASYVMNVTKAYREKIDLLIAANPKKYRRASFGQISGGFRPELSKTFNRGYTELFIDGERGRWASSDAPKSMGEAIGRVRNIRERDRYSSEITITPDKAGIELRNGDGFAFVGKNSIVGFRADICHGMTITCKTVQGLKEGTVLYRNISAAFEKTLESQRCRREIPVKVEASVNGLTLSLSAISEDGRTAECPVSSDQVAINPGRVLSMLREGLSKRSEHYCFELTGLKGGDGPLPLLSASAINGARRDLASGIDSQAVIARPLENKDRTGCPPGPEYQRPEELMRTKYCIRYELGMCSKYQGAKASGPLFLLNNSRRFSLGFDCRNCEMTLTQEQK